MRAITIPRFGGPEVLTLTDAPQPTSGPGDVSIDVAWAGVNYAEILFRSGVVDLELPYVPGIEVAGTVRAVGEEVTGLRPGQQVAALTMLRGGGYGQVAVTDARLVCPLPAGADLKLAAATPSNTSTAFLVLERTARLQKGESVLVHAAAGGVGSQLGQVARLLGASQVIGTVGSPEKIEHAKALGYDHVLLRDELPAAAANLTDGRGFDIAVDPVGGAARTQSMQALGIGGRLVAMGNASGADDVPFGANDLWMSGKAVLGFNLAALAAEAPQEITDALRRALTAVLDGSVTVPISRTFAHDEATEAHRHIGSGLSTGKTVLAIGA
ncbi:zinc-binding dehydrogenase [Streptomyces sp. NBC_01016]|uniref:quinone oxidoreductase family protein n=1 Tax=Streptomyces sp. NBC_01016 TaxID=2903720 RepID=UPI0022530F62|nr:zinc-binding dehydrogenase [Streptomyces sp. NBC_01016]MCX4834914.1 zinc-binding dehydrogenase [Streptomyces sp. NBC_01016]